MPVYYDKARKRWRYEFSRLVGGQRRRATKLLPKAWTAREAEAYGQEQDARIYAVATGAARDEPLISRAVLLYLEQHAPGLKNFDRLEADLNLCKPWYAGRFMNELADVVQHYRRDNPGLAPATIKKRMSYLRAACRWAWKNHRLGEHDPGERVVMPAVNNERHLYLDRRQVLLACRQTNHLWTRACMLVAFYSGMRISETVRAQATPRGWFLEDTKNGDPRLVPIHPKVAYLARQWPCPLAVRTIQQHAREALDAAGFPDHWFHDLRHSNASAMINKGVDLYTVGKVLGHRSPQSTQRYAHLAIETLDAAVRKIS